jgi:hypothetical protein
MLSALLPGLHDLAIFATFQGRLEGIKAQFAFLLLGSVTF